MTRKRQTVGDYRTAPITSADRAREQALPAVFVFRGPDVVSGNSEWPYKLVVAVEHRQACRAVNYYTGQVLATARGWNYNRTGAVLADVATRAYGVPTFNGAAGVEAVTEHCAVHGVTLRSLSEIVGAL